MPRAFALFNAFVAMSCLMTAAPYLHAEDYVSAAISMALSAGNAWAASFWLQYEP
jgi:hypothetical protein